MIPAIARYGLTSPPGTRGSRRIDAPSPARIVQVTVAAVACAVVELGHEREALAVLVGDLLGPVVVGRVVVAGGDHLVVAERHLLLAEVALALRTLAVRAGAVHAEPDRPHQWLHPAAGTDRVVDVVTRGSDEAVVAARERLATAAVDDLELELGPANPTSPSSARRVT